MLLSNAWISQPGLIATVVICAKTMAQVPLSDPYRAAYFARILAWPR
jgi:hypothetical protein